MRPSTEAKRYEKAVTWIRNRVKAIGEILPIRTAENSTEVDELIAERDALESIDFAVQRRTPNTAIRVGRSGIYACPRCGHHLKDERPFFCKYCGQHIAYNADEELVPEPKERVRAKLRAYETKGDTTGVLAITVGHTVVEVKLSDVRVAMSELAQEGEASIATDLRVIRYKHPVK